MHVFISTTRAVPTQKNEVDSDKDFSGRFSISTNPTQMQTDSDLGCFDPTCLLVCDTQKTMQHIFAYTLLLTFWYLR